MQMFKEKQKWVVVLFLMSKDCSVIPINWLLETKNDNLSNSSVKYCYWTPFKVTSNHLKEATNPDPSWQQYQIKIIGANKTYGM